jgi:8-oxo-dGTP diphosphatase
MRDVTLCFLIKEKDGQVAEICLAMKKRGFGKGRWNGVGGKVGDNNAEETIAEAAIRETQEEAGVEAKNLFKVGELEFFFPHSKDWDQRVHVYFAKEWVGEPRESEEMRPQWFSVENLPFESMWPDDIYWLPKVLNGDLVKARFVLGEGDVVLEKEVSTAESLT